jgi:acetolactate synthase-1/3 small subunit
MERLHIISALVEHKPGVLHKIANMFRARSFNIDTLSVGVSEQKDLARMTISIRGDERVVDQLIKQFGKLIDVVDVKELPSETTVSRELALIKLRAEDGQARAQITSYVDIFRARIVDVSPDSFMIEVTGTPD